MVCAFFLRNFDDAEMYINRDGINTIKNIIKNLLEKNAFILSSVASIVFTSTFSEMITGDSAISTSLQ